MNNEDNIQTYIEFHLNEVKLNISVKKDLTRYKEDEPLHHFGYIEVNTGYIDTEYCFWDGIPFFISVGKKEFKKECKKELQEKGFEDWKDIYRKIKKLLKRAKKLNLI